MALATMLPSPLGAGRGPRDLKRIGWCLLIVVGLHVSLLAVPARSTAPRTEAMGAARTVQLRAVRTVAPEPVSEATASGQASRPFEPANGSTDAVPRSTRNSRVEIDASPALADDGGENAPPLPDLGLYAWSADPVDDYYAHAELTVGPAPKEVVQIGYPAFDGERDLYVSELVLLIDETGVVSRVLLVGAPLPAPLEEAARSAFLQALFVPGERNGRAVKSRIRVEVVFDSRRIAS